MKSRSQTTTLVQDIFTTAEHLAAEAREDFGDATHRMRDVTSKAMNSVLHTLHFDQLPSWMQNDPYIQRGYRKPTGAIKDCLYSLCYPHNELVNTWSHLLPAMFFIALLVGVDYLELKELEHSGKEIRWEDLAMMQFYFVCTALCLLFSATFHGMNCHSVDMARRTLKLDYLGIVLTISSTCITSTYFGLYDNPRLQAIYISFTVLCGTTVFWMVLKPGVDGAHAAAWRAVVFICLGASGFGAIIHAGLTKGMEGLNPFPFPNIAITCSCYLVGAFLYVHRIPEKQWPGIFDLWGASHQLFHVLVAVGQIVFLYGLKDVLLLHYQDTSPIPMPLVGSNVHSWSLQQPVLGFCSNLSHSALESCAIMCT